MFGKQKMYIFNKYILASIYFTLLLIYSNLAFGKTVRPSIDIISSLPSDNTPSIIAGHSFTLTAVSINGSAGEVFFAATDPGIKLNPASCIVNPNGYCQVTAMITLGTPSNLHNIVVDYQSGGGRVELTRYQFKSLTPQLEIVGQPVAYSVRKNNTINLGFSIPPASIPEGYGVITVDLSYTSKSIVGKSYCYILYAADKITDNQCASLSFLGADYGISTIMASANDFTNLVLPPIVVPNKFAYVLGANEIAMMGEFSDGTLAPIQTHRTNPDIPAIPIEGRAGQMVLSPDGKFLYVTDTGLNKVIPYSIGANTGLPVMLNHLIVDTGNYPNNIVLTKNGNFAYVTNYKSNTISQYTVNKTTGALTPNKPATVATGLAPAGITIASKNDTYVYVANQGSNNIYRYTKDAKNGLLKPNSQTGILFDMPFAIAMNYDGRALLIAEHRPSTVQLFYIDKIVVDKHFIIYSDLILNGVYFNPVILSNGTNLGYLITNTNVIMYQVKASGYWENVGSLSWDARENGPNTMGFDPSGQYAFIGHQNSRSISMYKILTNSDGAMLSNGIVNSPVIPLGIVVSAN